MYQNVVRLILTGCCIATFICRSSNAADDQTLPTTNPSLPALTAPLPPAPPPNLPDFARGTWEITAEGAFAHSFATSPARIGAGSIGVGYFVDNDVSINLEAAGYSVRQPGPDSVITDLNLLLRHHVFVRDRFSLFLDVGGGVTYATAPTPYYATYFNFMAEAGAGVTWRLQDHLYLITGARWLHFSNASLKGPDRNPSINAWEGYLGVMFTF